MKNRKPSSPTSRKFFNPSGERGRSRPPLARMLRMHEWLMANRYPNCTKIAEEFEVSAKTVQRDVNFMRDRMRLPIEYDNERFGFHYTRPVDGFPAMLVPQCERRIDPWRQSRPAQIGEMPVLRAPGRNGFDVVIRFDQESARIVQKRIWHPTQNVASLPDGCVEMRLRARDEWDIVRWILSWGAHAWVVEPDQLRNRVREIAREILTRH